MGLLVFFTIECIVLSFISDEAHVVHASRECVIVHSVCRSAGYIELLVSKLGVTPPNLSPEQSYSRPVRWMVNAVSLSAYFNSAVFSCL